jgi:hypothetical protein
MTPGKVNFICPKGSSFQRTLTYKIDEEPVNLFGYNARLQVREFHYSDDFVIGLDSKSASAYIYTGGSAGTININMSPEITSAVIAGDYVYDLEIYTSVNVYRLIEGKFTVTPEVTR